MAIHPFTLDYSDAQVIKSIQVEAIQTVRKTSTAQKIDNKDKKKKNFNREKQERLGKELKVIFNSFDLIFEYLIGNDQIIVKIYDKNKELILEDAIESFEELLESIKKDKGKIIDLKI